jgi:hypothetical protein
VVDYSKIAYGAVHQRCIAEDRRLRDILARVNALNDNPAHYCKEIDDLTLQFASSASTVDAS